MSVYIGIEDLVANAIIELFYSQKDKTNNFVSFNKLEDYGAMVLEILEKDNKKAVLILSRENTNALLRDFSDFFEEKTLDGEQGISLAEGVNIDDLVAKFRGYLPLIMLKAFTNKEAVSSLA